TVNAAPDAARTGIRHRRARTYLGRPGDDPEEVLRERLPSDRPTPEEASAFRERLEIVSRCVEKVDVARLRFIEDLPEKEIALRQHMTRDAVAGQLKRLRRGLRLAFGEGE